MDEELAILREHLMNAKAENEAGVPFFSGTLCGVNVVLAQCGIGKVNAALATTLLLVRFKPRAVLNTGTAGGLHASFEVGDIVLGKEVCHHDVDATTFGYAYGQVPREPKRFQGDPALLSAALRAARELPGANVHTGLIASGDVFLDDVSNRDLVRSRFPDVFAAEMEGAAIAQVCAHFEVPSLIIRAVSDLAGEGAKSTHEDFLRHAADNSAKLVMAALLAYQPN